MKIHTLFFTFILLATVGLSQTLPTTQATPEAQTTPQQAGRGRGDGPARDLKLIVGPPLAHTAVENPLHLPADRTFASVADVAVNSKGHVFVFHRAPIALVEFDANGAFVRAFGEGMSNRPHGMRIDSGDNIWITDAAFHTVIKMDAQGKVLLTLGERGKNGAWDEGAGTRLLDQPTDVAFAPNGDVFVSQGHGGVPRILRFDKNGRFVTSWGISPAVAGGRTNIHTIVIDRNNVIWGGDREARRLLAFDTDGKLQRTVQMGNYVSGLSIGRDGLLYIATGYEGQVIQADWTGKVLGVTGKPGERFDEYGEAHHIAIGVKNEIFVADTNGMRVHKYVPR